MVAKNLIHNRNVLFYNSSLGFVSQWVCKSGDTYWKKHAQTTPYWSN